MTRKPFKARFILIALTLAPLTFGGTAKAFSDSEARRAILELREQVQNMAQQNRQIHLDFAEQMETLKQEVMSLRGSLEQLKWASGLADPSSQAGQNTSSRAADPQEQAAFEGPLEMFRSGKYKEAIDGFNLFIDYYPDSDLTPEARFYRGSSLYATQQFKNAIDGLNQILSDTPDDPRAPDALLIIAASQIEQDNLSGAKDSLQRILNDYPDTSAASTAQERLKLLE